MTIHRGGCGYIKSHWDNHKQCVNCSHCSRESTCSTCSYWSNSTWELAEKRRNYTSRKKVMSKKKKRSQALSDSSDGNTYGNTDPHGPAARGKTHKSGNSLGTCTQGSTSTGHRSTDQQVTSHRPLAQWTRRPHRPTTGHAWSPGMTGHRAVVTGQGSPATGQMGDTEISNQSMTDHRPSSHRSLDLERLNTGESQFSAATDHLSQGNWPPIPGHQTLYQPITSETHARGMEFTSNQPNSS